MVHRTFFALFRAQLYLLDQKWSYIGEFVARAATHWLQLKQLQSLVAACYACKVSHSGTVSPQQLRRLLQYLVTLLLCRRLQ